MTLTVTKMRLPVREIDTFSLEENDDRFQKVKIWIAHTGENQNHTSFSLEALEKMALTLPRVPIIGFIDKNQDDEDDFTDHKQRIVLKDGDIVKEFLTYAYGFMPEEPDAKIEYREGKEWLTAVGYLWNRFNKSAEIMVEDKSRPHSMEIDSISGYQDDDALMHITDARFTGLCILGEKVSPAMTGSSIDLFSTDTFKEEVQTMMYEFSQKGAREDLDNENLGTDTVEDVVEDVTVAEPEQAEGIEFTEDSAVVAEEGAVEPVTEDTTEDVTEAEPEAEPEIAEEFTLTFGYSFEDIRSKLYEALRVEHEIGYTYIVETFEDSFVYNYEFLSNDQWINKFYKMSYTLTDDNLVISGKTEVLSMFVTVEEKDLIDSNRNRIKELTEELEGLQEYKASIDSSEKTKILASNKEKLSAEAYSILEDTAPQLTPLELEKEVAFAIFKEKDSEQNDNSATRIGTYSFIKTDGKYGDLDRYFYK